MRRRLCSFSILAIMLTMAAHVLFADEAAVLPEFRVEGTPWLYAKTGDIEVLSRASPVRTRQFVAALVRGKRLYPDFFFRERALPLLLIIADSARHTVSGLRPAIKVAADERQWAPGYHVTHEDLVFSDEERCVIAINLGGHGETWLVLTNWANQVVLAQRPGFADWVTTGLFSPTGPFYGVIGIPRSTTVRFPRLSWPDPTVRAGEFPSEAREFPEFAVMFNPARNVDGVSPVERNRYQFQTALFARWSLFGPAKNGRNRNGYWVFAEVARRNGASEALFRECYGMDWAQACAEMRDYFKPKNVGMFEARMPHVMADVPEIERLKFRDATVEEVRRLLGKFNQLRLKESGDQNQFLGNSAE